MFFTFPSLLTVHTNAALLINTPLMQTKTPSAAHHSLLSPTPRRQIVFPVARWAAMHCMSAHLPPISSGPVLSACEWGAGTWQGHREDQMEFIVSSARTRGNNVAFAYFLSEGTQRQGHPLNPASGRRGYSFSTPMSCSTFELHLHVHGMPVTIAGRLHGVVLWKWLFFLWLDVQGESGGFELRQRWA